MATHPVIALQLATAMLIFERTVKENLWMITSRKKSVDVVLCSQVCDMAPELALSLAVSLACLH